VRGLRSARGLPFVLPYLPFLIAFGIAPMIYALKLAFTKVDGSWAGVHNFTRTADDYRFGPAFKHVLLYTSVWLGALIVFVVGLALLLHGRANRASSTFRFPSTSRARWPAPRPCSSGSSCSTRPSAPAPSC
jgi:multiple sugar transport system permease protein